ncbi:copper homeostasis protein [Acinetobacter sp. ANC 5054]|uniref:copper resistance protein NlpE n=1 Tax=Acinetobacter sp. ANC 5054 TaxID=1977877 RepID=UPI000A3519B0|nr:copper resistance protein NlpE [Acinetobacter sp. ANC 5054]OTG79999.1 copper homeostasis protein [Acinetobacter sp. ANC 5054]
MKKLIFALCIVSTTLVACSKTSDSEHATPPDNNVIANTDSASQSTTLSRDTTENALDWAGEYKGILPCHDCKGIETELELKLDKSFELTQKFLGKPANSENKVKGVFKFLPDQPGMIQLDAEGDHRIYFIGENYIEMRGDKGEKLEMPELNYRLTKDLN